MASILNRHNGNILAIATVLLSILSQALTKLPAKCKGGSELKYLWGDALSDSQDCLGPNNLPYPSAAITRTFKNSSPWSSSSRTARRFNNVISPELTRKALLAAHEKNSGEQITPSFSRTGRATNFTPASSCMSTPSRLCKTRYNTTAPMYGVSLTSGQPVTIVQKFPDLLQQVVFEVCESSECDVVRGECTQTYVPYLFLKAVVYVARNTPHRYEWCKCIVSLSREESILPILKCSYYYVST
ncbi:hypothetical protein QE152_g38162 [Popillia japonica]|uniref:Uncharacterized protein n=1 Tax=Popillia japonica TaxID=7064 RepID=A0AAW1I8R9_POPJA